MPGACEGRPAFGKVTLVGAQISASPSGRASINQPTYRGFRAGLTLALFPAVFTPTRTNSREITFFAVTGAGTTMVNLICNPTRQMNVRTDLFLTSRCPGRASQSLAGDILRASNNPEILKDTLSDYE